MERVRQVRDRDLTPEQLAEREVWRRKHEIDAQIVVALEKGNPVELLLTHPAGLIENRGGCKWLNATQDEMMWPPKDRPGLDRERAYIIQRYADLKARWASGKHFVELDSEISAQIKAGKRKGDTAVDTLAEIKVRCTKARRGELGPDAVGFARARGHKDLSQHRYTERGKAVGWMRELSEAELLAEHEANLAATLEAINADRAALGLPPVSVVEG